MASYLRTRNTLTLKYRQARLAALARVQQLLGRALPEALLKKLPRVVLHDILVEPTPACLAVHYGDWPRLDLHARSLPGDACSATPWQILDEPVRQGCLG